MLIQINTDIVATAYDLILVQNFHLQIEAWGKMSFLKGDMSSSVDTNSKNKDILILGEGLAKQLDDTTLTAETKYPINMTQPRKRFLLNLHYNVSKSFLTANATKMYLFKAKDSETEDYTLGLGNISKDLKLIMDKQTGLKGSVRYFSAHFNPTDTNDIFDIHRYLMKGT